MDNSNVTTCPNNILINQELIVILTIVSYFECVIEVLSLLMNYKRIIRLSYDGTVEPH